MATRNQDYIPELSLKTTASSISTSTSNAWSNQDGDTDSDLLCPPRQDEYLYGVRLILLLLSLMLGVFLLALDMSILGNAIPSITRSFHSLSDVTWYSSTFSLALAPLQSAYGKAYRYFDQKNTFLTSIAIFETGSLLSALAPNSPVLIIGRAVTGVGGGGIITGAFSIIAGVAPPRRVPICMSLLGVTFGFASIVGPLLGGALTSGPGWRWCFWINLPLGAVAAAVITIVFVTPRAANPPVGISTRGKFLQMDPAGVVLVIIFEVSFVLAMQLGGENGGDFSHPICKGALVVSAVALVAFISLEWQLGERAMIQYRLLRKAVVSANMVVTFFVSAAYFPLMYILPIYFQSVKNASPSNSGLWSIPFILGVSVFVFISSSSMPRVHWTWWLVIGPGILTVGMGCLCTLDLNTPLANILGFQLLTGVGIGLVLQVPIAANQALVPSSDIPAVIGMTLFFETIGNILLGAAVEASFVASLVGSVQKSSELASAGIGHSEILEAGAIGLRTLFPDNIAAILDCYMAGFTRALLILMVCASASLLSACAALTIYLYRHRGPSPSDSNAMVMEEKKIDANRKAEISTP
ncbi:Repressible high-affinity phosphate permease [Venturia nashicola]|uniref:Repressible high-affinity phosphate permease n=1 Tax=Venturia nashicola TaxID=86259 RepID=A0A4Z1P1N2_9PEZI|nr:Repressible high-affinity phosphate permease [Venturia nashicola]TLD19995.1 Repressible high-affinity phosphate permease [Venturia nashicola]